MPKTRRGAKDGAISDEYEDEPTSKRIKFEKTDSIVEQMNTLLDDISKPPISNAFCFGLATSCIPTDLLEPGITADQIKESVTEFKEACGFLHSKVANEITRIGSGGEMKNALNNCRLGLEKLVRLADDLQEGLLFKPPPSDYARSSVWKAAQAHPNPILCLRPTQMHGLPLTLLHSIFSRFHQLSRQPLPQTPAGAHALRVALGLCNCMGDGFKDEKPRGLAFDNQMGNFLPVVHGPRQLQGIEVSGEADRIYRRENRCFIIREDKAEMGAFGDAYTQISRSFDIACENMEQNAILADAPVFLLCIMGPSLLIAGGFKDFDDTIVEPLCPVLLVLKDEDILQGRAMQLAKHLYALRTCIEELFLLPNPSSPGAGLPRIFPSFEDAQGQAHALSFQRRLSKETLVFSAQVDGLREVCVKIVYGPYGKNVHQLLASKNMAPQLLGVSRAHNGPAAVVMELLDPAWETLYYFAQTKRWSVPGIKATVLKRLKSIVSTLADEGLVHGDFRVNNIIVKPGEEESALLVDFDWAGEDKQVRYPLSRNTDVHWSGDPGSEIRVAHDQEMLERQWSSLLKDFP